MPSVTNDPPGLWRCILAVAICGLLGPSVRLTVPPGSAAEPFIYDLTWLLWPTQALAVAEVSVGRAVAFMIALGANVALFTVVGILVALVARKPALRRTVQAAVVFALGMWAAVGAGFDATFMNWPALIVASVIVSGAIWIGARLRSQAELVA
jgi:hypothetical protein